MNKKHGMYKTAVYRSWVSLIKRCENKNGHKYPIYGGRGIKVCDAWRKNFMNFYNDMGDRPTGMTIERIDNNGPYTKENCRWATPAEQANNRSSCLKINYNSQTKNLNEWSAHLKMSRTALYKRIYAGWTVQEIFETPIQSNGRGKKSC